ncbi:MAG: gamma-glutamyl-phosphate reductase, partial [Planctomycetota bacterium]|nr:gamma-glutamyl-phosphate reductase [Planctomycetota bacterium]
MAQELREQVETICRAAREASWTLASLPTATKDAWLLRTAERLEAARPTILEANERDIEESKAKGLAAPMVRRLSLEDGKWENMVDGLRQVAALRDPVGEIMSGWVRPNGLRIEKVRVPLGVIL